MSQQIPSRASDPGIPGSSQACIDERAARKLIEESIGGIARELAGIRSEIGKAPDPTGPEHEREGTGLKGIAIKTFEGLIEVSGKVDKLTTSGSLPPGAQSSIVKRASIGIVIVFVAIQQAWTLYQTMRPTLQPQTAPTSAQK